MLSLDNIIQRSPKYISSSKTIKPSMRGPFYEDCPVSVLDVIKVKLLALGLVQVENLLITYYSYCSCTLTCVTFECNVWNIMLWHSDKCLCSSTIRQHLYSQWQHLQFSEDKEMSGSKFFSAQVSSCFFSCLRFMCLLRLNLSRQIRWQCGTFKFSLNILAFLFV